MTTLKEIIAKNTEALKAIINGDVDRVTVAGVGISKVDFTALKYRFEVGCIIAYADEIEILGYVAHLKNRGAVTATLSLME